MTDAHLIVGLGNPGPQYAATRHNIGQLVTELLAARCGTSMPTRKHARANAAVAETRLPAAGGVPGPRVVIAQPWTFMNVSGGPVAALTRYYGLEPSQVIVAHDDVDLPFGAVRLKLGGGEGGHNGLRDISRALGTRGYYRVRLGVGRPPGGQDTADFVLSRFTKAEVEWLPAFIDDGADATTMLITDGLLAAQQRFHARPETTTPTA